MSFKVLIFCIQVLKSVADLSRSLTEENYKGLYDEKYLTLKSIGKGAFGFVKLAQRRSDKQEVSLSFMDEFVLLETFKSFLSSL